jgi:hypothetical protein
VSLKSGNAVYMYADDTTLYSIDDTTLYSVILHYQLAPHPGKSEVMSFCTTCSWYSLGTVIDHKLSWSFLALRLVSTQENYPCMVGTATRKFFFVLKSCTSQIQPRSAPPSGNKRK